MSVKKKPLVVVTRKLPDSIETRMRELFDARLNLDDTPLTPEQIADAVRSLVLPSAELHAPVKSAVPSVRLAARLVMTGCFVRRFIERLLG